MAFLSNGQKEEMQVVLEDIRNHLTVLKGIIQISSKKLDKQKEKLLVDSINKADVLIGEAFTILDPRPHDENQILIQRI